MFKIPVCHLFKLYISKSKVSWAKKQQIVETIFRVLSTGKLLNVYVIISSRTSKLVHFLSAE